MTALITEPTIRAPGTGLLLLTASAGTLGGRATFARIGAVVPGIVTEVRWEEGYGNMITMDHGYGDEGRSVLRPSRFWYP